MYYLAKILITTLLIVAISEVSKRSSFLGAVLASVPLVSVLAMIWLYVDTKDIEKVSELSSNIVWLIVPSLALFVIFPILLKNGLNFYISLSLSTVATVFSYFAMVFALKYFGIKL